MTAEDLQPKIRRAGYNAGILEGSVALRKGELSSINSKDSGTATGEEYAHQNFSHGGAQIPCRNAAVFVEISECLEKRKSLADAGEVRGDEVPVVANS